MKQFLILSFLTFLFAFHPLSASAGDLEGWAWGGGVTLNPVGFDGIGWISMGSTVAPTYAVNVPSSGNLSGYAWSEHYGWISFNASDVAGCPGGGICDARRSGDNILGWARIISICDTGNAGNAHTRDGHCDAGDDGWNAGGWNGWIKLDVGGGHGLLVSRMNKSGVTPTYAYSDELGWIDFSFAGFGNTLTICEGSFPRKLGTSNIPLSSNATTTLTARYGLVGNCSDPLVSVTWSTENNPDDAISLPTPTPIGQTVVVTAKANITPSSKEENVIATCGIPSCGVVVNETAKAVVSCLPRTCSNFGAQTSTYCPNESRIMNNACGGTISCSGTRHCNYNFTETSP